MNREIPLKRRIKLEDNGNTLIQSYINTFNKEIEENDSPLREAQSSESPPLQITDASDNLKLSDTMNIDQVDENIADDDNQNGTYFIDDQGRYYFSDNQQVITSVGEVITPDNEILLAEDSTNDILVEPPENYQTVTIVPSETANGEVSYVLIVQQPDEKSQSGDANPAEIDNLTVYDFDENEELADENNETGDEDDKTKAVSPKKQPVIPKPYMCSYCSYTTAKKYLLTRHLKSHSVERPHKCSVCSRGFKTLASLQNHLNTHTGTKPHKCRFCDSAFTTSGELVRHVRYRHTHEKPHKCNECEYASVELSKLKRHARCHTGERPYQCPHCTYASPDTFKLKRHLRTHTGEKPYECEYCHMCFTQSNSLKAHKLTHNIGDKPVFHCELCPTTCGRKTDLRIHVQKLHTADKPLKCRRCGKSYPDRYTFKMHNKTHEGEKCFKCEMCPYASTSRRHLSTHMLVHTDEKPYSCEKCDQTFRQKQLLKRHQNLYHNPEYIAPLPKEKSHECIQCSKHFRYKGNLIRHMAIHDPESSIHEKSLALKLGRQRKIQLLNPQSAGIDYDGDNNTDNEVEMNYIVFEVIQAPEENSNCQVSLVSPKTYEDDEYEEGEEEEEEMEEEEEEEEEDDDEIQIKSVKSKSKSDQSADKLLSKEKDVENCFGFDDDEADEDFNEEKMTLSRDTLMKFGI